MKMEKLGYWGTLGEGKKTIITEPVRLLRSFFPFGYVNKMNMIAEKSSAGGLP